MNLKRFSSILIVILILFISKTMGQFAPQYTEYISQSRFDDSEDWQNEYRTEFALDDKGNIVGRKFYQWLYNDPNTAPYRNMTWTLASENTSVFNTRNRMIREESKSYDTYNRNLRYESSSESKYLFDTLLTEYISTWNSPQENSFGKSRRYLSYDEFGRITSRKSIFGSTYQGSSEKSGSEFIYYYDENGCEVATVNLRLDPISENEEFTIVDSASIGVNQNCYQLQYDRFQYTGNFYSLVSQIKNEYEFDKDGQPTQIRRLYRESELVEYELQSEQQISRTDTSEVSEYTDYTSQFSYINSYVSNNSGQPLYYSYKSKHLDSASFDSEFWTEIEYNDDGNIISVEEYAFYDSFMYNTLTSFEYDEQGYEVRRILNGTTKNFQSGFEGTNTSETISTRRCDGALKISTEVFDYGDEYYNNQGQERTLFSYQRLADCEPIESKESELNLFPNPASAYFHIWSEVPFGKSRLIITDSRGSVMQDQEVTLSNYEPISINFLKPGTYLLQVISETGNYSGKFVKM